MVFKEEVDRFGLPLEEMARLGVEDGYDYRLYSEPLGNPSFHIKSKEFEIVVTIKDLTILEVKPAEKSKFKFTKGKKLTGDILKKTLALMGRKVPHTAMTVKQFLVITWNANNPKTQIEPSFLEW